MAMGNLVEAKWRVAGIFDPRASSFTELREVILWPKTSKLTPQDWLACEDGNQMVQPRANLSFCELCAPGYSSIYGRPCSACAAGPPCRGLLFQVYRHIYQLLGDDLCEPCLKLL